MHTTETNPILCDTDLSGNAIKAADVAAAHTTRPAAERPAH